MDLLYTALYLLTIIFNVILGIIVWLKNPISKVNQSLVLFIVNSIVWLGTLYFLYSLHQEGSLLTFVGRLNYVAGTLAIYFIFLFSYYFPKVVVSLHRTIIFGFFIESLVLST